MNSSATYKRAVVDVLVSRLKEERRFMQIVIGPRQTGKSTAILQALDSLDDVSTRYVQASPGFASTEGWLRREWAESRSLANSLGRSILVIDEVQLIDQWSSVVKELWDEDTRNGCNLLVVLSGSSALFLQHGLTEGLTGRFEIIRCDQWDFAECEQAFGFTLDDYLYFGGYPGAAPLKDDKGRWLDYMQQAIITPSIMSDVISLENVTKPALMEALFTIGVAYSGQEVSYRKIMGQLEDAGNTTTIAKYLGLLRNAGLVAGLQKYSPKLLKVKASSPRLITFDTSLMVTCYGQLRDSLLTDPERRGHLVECAVGAYLLKRGLRDHFDVQWWRDGNSEVDFVLTSGPTITAIEVKSGRVKNTKGLIDFCSKYPVTRSLVIGNPEESGINATIEELLRNEVELF